MAWFFTHLSVIVAGFVAGGWFGITATGLNWWLLSALSLVMGFSFAGLAFVAHEALHGAIVSQHRARTWLGRVGFAAFCISPRLWMAWHNRVHHGHTNIAGLDPDAYPSLEEYNTSPGARWFVKLGAPRSGKWRGIITFLFGFSIQSLQILLWSKARGHLPKRHFRAAVVESLATAALWLCCAWWLGPARFFMLYAVPVMIANAIVMSYIVTNHSLNPLVDHDDTLTSTLSVTVPTWYEVFSLQFGYHVEHHLFPAMSHAFGPLVREELLQLAPHRYQSLPLLTALRIIATSPRVYDQQVFLFDPHTQERMPTLAAREAQVADTTSHAAPALLELSDEQTVIRTRMVALPLKASPSEAPPRAS